MALIFDTPPHFKLLKSGTVSIPVMALEKRATGGRPSLGPRHAIQTKLPIPEAEKLRELTDLLGTSSSAYISQIMIEHLSTIDMVEVRSHIQGQEALPLDQAS